MTSTNVDDDAKDIKDMVLQARNGQWTGVYSILDRKKYIINCIPDDRAWGALHQAAYLQAEGAVRKLLSYPTCDWKIKTKQDQSNESGPGKTPEWIATNLSTNKTIISILQSYHNNVWKERFGGTIPTYTTYQDGKQMDTNGPPLLLLTLANFKKTFHPSSISIGEAFKTILKKVFDFETAGTHWKHAMEKVSFSIGAFDLEAGNLLATDEPSSDTTDEQRFFARTIKLYSMDHVYREVNESLRRQSLESCGSYKATADDLALGPYSLLLDVLLFYWSELKQVSDTTYRGMGLNEGDLKKYSIGTRFIWLSFVSSSKQRSVAIQFATNVLFEISNDTPGADYWRPRDLSHAYLDLHEYHEEEALYPGGAEFEVTATDQQLISGKPLTVIKLKLLNPTAESS